MGQMKQYGPRPHISVARPLIGAPGCCGCGCLTEAGVRAIARQEVDAMLDEMAEQALAAMK